MKIIPRPESASVLITSLLTITILTMICATSLYIVSQNQNTGMQTSSWQQALSGAETAVDQAVLALNTGVWTSWSTYTGTAPVFAQPGASPAPTAASGAPASGKYNYLYTASTVTYPTSEGNNSLTTWVTVDPAS